MGGRAPWPGGRTDGLSVGRCCCRRAVCVSVCLPVSVNVCVCVPALPAEPLRAPRPSPRSLTALPARSYSAPSATWTARGPDGSSSGPGREGPTPQQHPPTTPPHHHAPSSSPLITPISPPSHSPISPHSPPVSLPRPAEQRAERYEANPGSPQRHRDEIRLLWGSP